MPTFDRHMTASFTIHGSTDRQKLIYAAENFAKAILKEKTHEKKSIKRAN